MSRRGRAAVAVYAPLAGRFYDSPPAGPTGGAELQSLNLCLALAERGFSVRHIVFGSGEMLSERAGIDVIRLPPQYGLPRGVTRGATRRAAILRTLRDADARVYVQRGAGFETGMVGAFARAMGRRFVFSSSSDADFRDDPATAVEAGAGLDHRLSRIQYRLGRRLAHAVVVQTEGQLALARAAGLPNAIAIPSFCLAPPEEGAKHREKVFLWVGGLVAFKDPLAYVQLARSVPEATFWMVGTDRGPAWRGLADEVRALASEVPNLELLDPRPRSELLELYGRVRAVVSTSHFEGFPNAFLEAWARATPALSLRVDPNHAITSGGLGVVADGSLSRLAESVRTYDSDPSAAAVAGARARAYVLDVHSPARVGDLWAELIARLRG